MLKNFKVLDEADRLRLDTFSNDLSTIFVAFPAKRQNLLFSATMTSSVDDISKISFHKPFIYEIKSS